MRTRKEVEAKLTEVKELKANLLSNLDKGYVSEARYTVVCSEIKKHNTVIAWLEWMLEAKD